MQKLSLLSACIFALFLASCGGSSGGGGGGVADKDGDGVPDSKDLCENSLNENFISSSITDDDTVARTAPKTKMVVMAVTKIMMAR